MHLALNLWQNNTKVFKNGLKGVIGNMIKYEINGDTIYIKMNQEKITIIDADDEDLLKEFSSCSYGVRGYAILQRSLNTKYGKVTQAVSLHRAIGIIRKLVKPKGSFDHKDRNKLNNKKSNLRAGNWTLNSVNRNKMQKKCSSGFKGASKTKRGSWEAYLTYKKKKIFLGTYKTDSDAARAYDKKAIQLYGDWAVLNFPKDG